MADTRPFRPDAKYSEDYTLVWFTDKELDESIRKPRLCGDRKTCQACEATYHTESLQRTAPFSYRRRLTDEDAGKVTSKLVYEIQSDRRHISGRLERHADIVMSRWAKNGRHGSQQKREKLLSEVAEDLAKTPEDIIAYNYSKEKSFYMRRSLSRRRRLLQPWLNVEVLKMSPDTLLALLYCRTAYGPSEWAAFDGQQLRKYWVDGHFDCDHSSKTIVMYGEGQYGSLVDWDAEEIHRADTVGFPFGYLVLEAQAYLMGLLRKIIDRILQDIDASDPVRTDKWRQATKTGAFRRTNDIEPWSPYTRGAFCAPPRFDLAYLTSLAQSRREKAEDHLRDLQCNPAYLRRHIRLVADSTLWNKSSDTAKGTWFAMQMSNATESYYLWRFVEDECRHVDEICRRHGEDAGTPGRPLPQEVDTALGQFDNWMANQIIHRTRTLWENLAISPAFSKHWRSKPVGDYAISSARFTENDSLSALRDDPLDWCLAQIVANSGENKLYDHSRLFCFLEEYVSTSKISETRRLDELLLSAVDDLAAVHEMMNLTRLRRPQSPATPAEDMRQTLGRRATSEPQKLPKKDIMFKSICRNTGPQLVKIFGQYRPPQGLKGQAWVDQQKELRSSMRTFWDSIRKLKQDDYSKTNLSAIEKADLLKVISADLCPVHQKAAEGEEVAVYASMKRRREVLTEAITTFTNDENKAETYTREDGRVRNKNKKKTRADNPEEVQPEEPPSDLSKLSLEDRTTRGAIVVPKKTFDEFVCELFPTEKNEGRRGVDWQTFVRGMTAVGCSVGNSGGGGSEVLFSHESFGKITFHKPHPEPKVDTIKLRSWGHRLEKRFGWSRERFVVAGAQQGQDREESKDKGEVEAS
ncbi:ycfA-like protein domain-containing protein [Diaporthe amygdali]|uniref:ycfA-like protein domain-containing protein n=1 Tax=Phomopsis amygdali TaxID=1214568 RepID=UPI0022FDBD76|nr:ycfA-like protein domain-containing protein [Diaporthe amygdali]KAJ0122950.1 ycfA-like protein domain-containing protein [Diaporthe amygdali]